MPPRVNRVHGPLDRGAAAWYHELPPLTKGLLTVYLVTGLGAWARVMPLKYIYHDWGLVFKRVPEVWRLATNFTVAGFPSSPWLFRLIWLVIYGGSYETSKFAANTADGLMMLFVGLCTCMSFDLFSFVAGSFIPRVAVLSSSYHGSATVFQFVYLWSKQNSNALISLYGFININGRHLPVAFLALDLLMGGDIWSDIMGIFMGHMYWFLTEVYPMASGRTVVRTPIWLVRLCLRYGIGRVPIQAAALDNPNDVRFRAFQGRARRLAD
ncbi:Derlin-1 [Micractinium conductrix]|uniref:Derlin n=1 Tax=Micractinium conductrix TaxID=554055 RepID=A0A2P6VB82_9CHLO|nr:Derlin-1 [Micractinium conductrix]|eukprot:PSC71343.1 Derlin-1 [Micractinium conductrix]